MGFLAWLRARPPGGGGRSRGTCRPAASRFRPNLELLEARCLPSGGVLDPTFGSGGVIDSPPYGRGYAVATYANQGTANDGKIIVAGVDALGNKGGFAVWRYNLDGTPDRTFGGTGEVITVQGGPAMAVAIQPDGKVVVAGWSRGDFTVLRYNVDGTADSTFGTKGTATLTFSKFSSAYVYNVVVQPDGKIVLAGETGGGTSWDLGLMRLNANGTLDNSFGSGGKVITHFASSLMIPITTVHLTSLAIDLPANPLDPNSGKLIVALRDSATDVVRYNTNGTLDTSFGGTGDVHLALVNPAVAVQPDDRIVVVGHPTTPTDVSIEVERLNPDGSPDASFGSGGVAVVTSDATDTAYCVALQPDGKIVLGGRHDWVGAGSGFMAARVNPDGSVDASFGTGGIVAAPPGTGRGDTVALEPDGRIVIAGMDNGLLARFLAAGPQIRSFTASPNPVTARDNLTLTTANVAALNPGSTVTQVAFYADSNGDGVLDAGDAQLTGTLTQSGSTWTLTTDTTGWAAGTYTLFAQAQDSYGAFSDPLAATEQVF
jgi:uncharacterized delta-60 repeat protein